MTKTLSERFWEKVDTAGPCWEWTGATGRGYGQLWHDGRNRKATHVSWFLSHGRWPTDGKMLCHNCDNKACVRPEHLYEGTQVENQRDTYQRGPSPIPKMNEWWRQFGRRTHCDRGHQLENGNLYIDRRGWRRCRQCVLDRGRRLTRTAALEE